MIKVLIHFFLKGIGKDGLKLSNEVTHDLVPCIYMGLQSYRSSMFEFFLSLHKHGVFLEFKTELLTTL